jgi:hypothetical protein
LTSTRFFDRSNERQRLGVPAFAQGFGGRSKPLHLGLRGLETYREAAEFFRANLASMSHNIVSNRRGGWAHTPALASVQGYGMLRADT